MCPVCGIYEARKHPLLGMLPCGNCKARRDEFKSPDHPVEFTTSSIKEGRKEYYKDIVQPFRGNEVSKEFIDLYPNKAKTMFTEKEIRKAKSVWK